MSIFITGDIHGEHDIYKLGSNYFDARGLTKDDYMIICGDFGLIWDYRGETKEERYWLDWLENKPWTTLFVDGNHECINSKSDVLTENGWMNVVDAYNSNVKIANVDTETHKLSFDYPLDRIKKHSDTIIDICGINFKQSVTPGHDVLINGEKVKAGSLLGKDIYEEELRYHISSSNEKIDLSPIMIEILTATVMDGTIVDYSKYSKNSKKIRVQFHFKKQRKIDYITSLLDEADIAYTIGYGKNNDTFIRIYGDYARNIYELLEFKKELPRYFTQMNFDQFQYLLHALSETDATPVDSNIIWRTTSLNDVNVIQELCVKHNCDMRVKTLKNGSGYKTNCKIQYVCSMGFNKNLHRKVSITQREYNDYVYCFTMPKGTLVTRYDYCISVTGNCFTRLNNDYEIEEWNGGKVHRIGNSIYHLMRGEVFNLQGKLFFCMGGAPSHDIEYRTENKSWWRTEVPSQEEREKACETLDKYNWNVDYVITHDAPSDIAEMILWGIRDYSRGLNEYTNWLQYIAENLDFKRWFFGHYHVDRTFDDGKFNAMYNNIKLLM